MTALLVDAVALKKGSKFLLDGVSLRVESGETVALVGPNGSGKTTLLRCILGLERPCHGKVSFAGKSSLRLTAKERAQMVAFLAQHTNTDEAISVIEYVATARFRFNESRAASEKAAYQALARVGAEELARQPVNCLSGGERQRIALSALLAQDARIQLLDEPANHLDPARQAQSYALLGEMQLLQTTMVIVTHDVNLLGYLHWPEQVRVLGMSSGKIAFNLQYGDDALVGELSRLYGVPMQRVESAGHTFILPILDAAKGTFT